ncbi:MAG: UDP-N-acetylmuramate--L-alanine ligase [Candidatus Paceibacterota bacterium]|jgi:UDP-N-acetylmuramate--alanine ligase
MKIHIIGIGGIGVSALAQYYLSKGYRVSGSDLVSSEITDALKKKGAEISIGKNIKSVADLLVYSPAVKPDNLELKAARKAKIKCQSYPEALGELTKEYFTIAVSGTHGKSTTTAMAALVLEKAGLDPTVIIGTKIKEFGDTNFRPGEGKYLLIEADEHFASFLNYWPRIITLTNIEADHLDFYKNLGNILRTFKKYISHLGKDGVLIANADDKNIKKILGKNDLKIRKYGLKQKEARTLKKILKVPGTHNVYNALAVLFIARELGIPDKKTFKALSEYKGAWRRFEIVQEKPFVLISDYGHNPTKMMAGLKAAREKYPRKEIWCVYQPHQKQRTHYLFKEFVKAFRTAPTDKIIITDIYDVAGREEKGINVSSQGLVEAVKRKNVIYLKKDSLSEYLKENVKKGTVLIVMGAGDIYLLVDELRLTGRGKGKRMN